MWKFYNWFFKKILFRPGLQKHRLISWFIGSDAYKLTHYPPGTFHWYCRIWFERIVYRLIEPFIFEYWCKETLEQYLLDFGIDKTKIRIIENADWDRDYTKTKLVKYEKKEHPRYTIIYYYPKDNPKFRYMIYGIYHIEQLIEHFKNCVEFMRLDGTKDMAEVLPIVDAYIRPSAYEGCIPRLVRECRLNEVPVYFKTGQQDLNEIKNFICTNCTYPNCINEKSISKWDYKNQYLIE